MGGTALTQICNGICIPEGTDPRIEELEKQIAQEKLQASLILTKTEKEKTKMEVLQEKYSEEFIDDTNNNNNEYSYNTPNNFQYNPNIQIVTYQNIPQNMQNIQNNNNNINNTQMQYNTYTQYTNNNDINIQNNHSPIKEYQPPLIVNGADSFPSIASNATQNTNNDIIENENKLVFITNEYDNHINLKENNFISSNMSSVNPNYSDNDNDSQNIVKFSVNNIELNKNNKFNENLLDSKQI